MSASIAGILATQAVQDLVTLLTSVRVQLFAVGLLSAAAAGLVATQAASTLPDDDVGGTSGVSYLAETLEGAKAFAELWAVRTRL